MGVDPFETLSDVEGFRLRQGHRWPAAVPEGSMVADLRITAQSTKIAIDHRGIIAYRDGFGKGDEEVWRQVMSDLAQGAAR